MRGRGLSQGGREKERERERPNARSILEDGVLEADARHQIGGFIALVVDVTSSSVVLGIVVSFRRLGPPGSQSQRAWDFLEVSRPSWLGIWEISHKNRTSIYL